MRGIYLDVGAVMEVYEPDGLEVEFVTSSGRTQARVTLKAAEVAGIRVGETRNEVLALIEEAIEFHIERSAE